MTAQERSRRRRKDPAAGVEMEFGVTREWGAAEGRYRAPRSASKGLDRLRDWCIDHPGQIATIGGQQGLTRRKAESVTRALRLSDPATRLRARGELLGEEARARRGQAGEYEVDLYARDAELRAWWINVRYAPAAGASAAADQLEGTAE